MRSHEIVRFGNDGGWPSGATVLFGQGNQEAANLTREGIEASKAKMGQSDCRF